MGRGRSKKPKGRAGPDEQPVELAGSTPSPAATAAAGLLSPELMVELGVGSGSGGGEAVIVASTAGNEKKNVDRRKKRQRERAVDGETRELAATLSKSKAKKLKQLQDKKMKDGRRAELYRKLGSNKLAPDQLSLLQSSKSISQNQDTLRSRLKQSAQRAAAGMVLPAAAVKELESHPEMVADIDEALALPVGGALAAVRRTGVKYQGEAAAGIVASQARKEKGVGNVSLIQVNESKAGGEVRKTVVEGAEKKSKVKGRGEAPAPAPAPGVAGVAATSIKTKAKGSEGNATATTKAAATADGTRSRATIARRGLRLRPSVEVVAVRRRRNSSSSSGSSSNSSGSSGGKDVDSERNRNHNGVLLEAGAESPAAGVIAAGEPDGKGGQSEEVANKADDSNGTTAAISGASWAAKMMSSLARVPTAADKKAVTSIVSQPGGAGAAAAEAVETFTSDRETAVRAEDIQNEARSHGTETSSVGAVHGDNNTEAIASYPPLPKWVDGKAPVYHAVQTPLPFVSDTAGAAGGRGPKDDRLRLQLLRPKRWIPVARSVELQAVRMQLPVCGMEQEIMEAIHDNDAVILCGETGSGKSTQLPQFLYEAGYAAHGLIGVTQPRRVAAVSTAERVAVELGTPCGRQGAVAYQIRYHGSGVGPKTRIKFMTDGVLMQEITSDLLLRKYSAVLLDEAHERNLNTDVLLGMLSRALPLR